MRALVYSAANSVSFQQKPVPTISSPSDAIVKLTKTTICGTDLHILKGHEGVGVVFSTGSSISRFCPGGRVLISCISSCAACEYCRRAMYSHCTSGGWILGKSIDGTQAQYVRVPHADSSLHKIPVGADDAAMVMLSDIFPTGLQCGVENGRVQNGATVAVVGAGPVGLAALMTAQMYSPSQVIVLGGNGKRLDVAKELGATTTVNNKVEDAVARVKEPTDGKGCDVVIEAVGVPATFALCQELVAPGGVLANVGVHGSKVDLYLDRLWDKNISTTTRLVDTVSTPMLLNMVESGKLRAERPVTHRFKFDQMEEAYKTFSQASQTGALKVLIDME